MWRRFALLLSWTMLCSAACGDAFSGEQASNDDGEGGAGGEESNGGTAPGDPGGEGGASGSGGRGGTSGTGGSMMGGEGGDTSEGGSGPSGGGGSGAVAGSGTGGGTTGDLPIGERCASAGECASGHCADGVCCDAACNQACRACSSSYTGLADGICGLAAAGTDPRNRCSGSDICTEAGLCRCQNGVKDGSETCTDCGGADCPACNLVWQCNCSVVGAGCCVSQGCADPVEGFCLGTETCHNGDACTELGETRRFGRGPLQDLQGVCSGRPQCAWWDCTCGCPEDGT
jgi:hypothetical protein